MCGAKKCSVHAIGWLLLVVGGLNWGLIGLNANWNVVKMIFGSVSWLERLIYILVGVSAIMALLAKQCKPCQVSCGKCGGGPEAEKKV